MKKRDIALADTNELIERLVHLTVYECYRTMIQSRALGKASAKEIEFISDELSKRAGSPPNGKRIVEIVNW